MSDGQTSRVLVLRTGLFPDAGTLEAALETRQADLSVKRIDIAPARMDAAQWDSLVKEVLAADKVITI